MHTLPHTISTDRMSVSNTEDTNEKKKSILSFNKMENRRREIPASSMAVYVFPDAA